VRWTVALCEQSCWWM